MSVGVGGHVTLSHANSTGDAADTNTTWSVHQCWDSLDQVDHLILLPERALTMDSGWLQADLAEIWAQSVSGVPAAAVWLGHDTPCQGPASLASSTSSDPLRRRRSLDSSSTAVVAMTPVSPLGQESCPATNAANAAAAASSGSAIQRDERNKVLRERQNEERQRKLEELKQQAVATQKFREQQEEERRRRMEEQRLRDLERRTQVEERKKAILEAEKERREAMLRRSEDRGVRMELKRRSERGSIAFAFGSSTPRMLEPVESISSYWGSRRATSTTNVMSSSVQGRVTVTDNAPSVNGSKRASSVFGLDLNQGDDLMTQSTSAVLGGPSGGGGGRRRRTDLIPTIPLHRPDSLRAPSPRCTSSASSTRGSVSRSTGMSMSMSLSRLDQLSQPPARRRTSNSAHLKPLHENAPPPGPALSSQRAPPTPSPTHTAAPPPLVTASASAGSSRRRPADLPVVALSMSKSMSHLSNAAVVATPTSAVAATPTSALSTPRTPGSNPPWLDQRTTRAERLRLKARQMGGSKRNGLRSGDVTPSSPTRPLSALSQVSSASTTPAPSSGHHVRSRTAPVAGRKPRPVSIAGTGLSGMNAHRTSRENVREPPPAAPARDSRERSKDAKENEKTARQTSAPRPARARSVEPRKETPPAAVQQPVAKPSVEPPRRKKTKEPKKKDKEDKEAAPAKAAEAAQPKPTAKEEPVETVEPVTVEPIQQLDEVETSAAVAPSTEAAQPLKTDDEVEAVDSGNEEPVDGMELIEDAEFPAESEVGEPIPAEPVASTEGQNRKNNGSGEQTPVELKVVEVAGTPTGEAGSGRKIISSEEEAKAALAEKRRLAREQIEREAERERKLAEEMKRLEEERLLQEELEQKQAEAEMDRIAVEARKAEEERLQKAIEETQRREEDERLRREEEARQRVEKEQQERKAREEAERFRKENEERLRREEEERQERRKRVEAIMSRTRGKSGGPKTNDLNSAPLAAEIAADLTPTSQPDLLGDLVNKSNGQSAADERKNGFHDSPSTTDLPDISVITNADSVNSNANIVEEHVEYVA